MIHGFGILTGRIHVVPGLTYAFFLMPRVYVSLQRFYGAPSMSIYRELWCPRVCQFTEILWRPEYVNLQRFCRDFTGPRVCQFTEILWCLEYVNLQRFYGALSMSIYRDFMVPWVCQFTEILWYPEYVYLQRFCRDFMLPRLCQFTEILHDKVTCVKSL